MIVHSTKTITPKEDTKTVYSTDVVKITPSCVPYFFPPLSHYQRHGTGSRDKRSNPLPFGVVPLVEVLSLSAPINGSVRLRNERTSRRKPLRNVMRHPFALF